MIIAIVLALFHFGWVGTIINGQVMKGVALLVGWIALGAFSVATLGLGLSVFGLYYVFILIDTIVIGLRVGRGEKVGEWDFFWTPATR